MEKYLECALLGECLLRVQKIEFTFYGIIAHLPPKIKVGKMFKKLTPEQFLREPEELKATLGQLESVFGTTLFISTSKFVKFIKNRNLIAHNYWRFTNSNMKEPPKLKDPESFLRDFITDCHSWQKIINGLLWVFMEAAAKKENRIKEIKFSDSQKQEIEAFYKHVSENKTL